MDWKNLVLGFCLLGIHLTAAAESPPALDVTFLDVGEGEAILLASGGATALIDAGNLLSGHQVITHLREQAIDTLDHLIVTHPHLDHFGGIFHLLPEITVGQRYDNGQPLKTRQDTYRWYEEAFRATGYQPLSRGDEIELGSATLRVLSPGDADGGNINQRSLVILVEHGKVRLLLMADATLEVEKRLLASAADLRADLLKLGHHGAADATSIELLGAVRPDYAVISINADNVRGYPAQEVVERVEQRGITVLKTYEHGDIRFSSDGESLVLQPRDK